MIRQLVHILSTAAVGLAVSFSVVGCSKDPVGEDITGGVNVSLSHRDGNLLANYALRRDGQLTFAGGADARNQQTSWVGHLTQEQARSIVDLARQAGWFDRAPEKGEKSDLVWTVNMEWPEGKRLFTAYGERPEIRAVYLRFDELARSRFDEYLQTLPKPGQQRN